MRGFFWGIGARLHAHEKSPADFRQRGLRGMARRFVSGLEFYRNVIGRPIGDAREARPGVGQASRLEPREDAPETILPSCKAVCILFALQSFLVQNFALSRGRSRPSLHPGIRRSNERSCYLSCPRACASKTTILELEADRRRNHPDGSRGISVCRPGSSIVGNGGIGGRSPRHLASPLGISRIRCRP